MNNLLTPSSIANQVLMLRQQFFGAVVLVEGPTDSIFFSKFTDELLCEVIPAHNKENVIKVFDILKRYNSAGVLCIVDRDFWSVDKVTDIPIPSDPSILSTDTHDVETMVMKTRALDSVLGEYGSRSKIRYLKTNVRNALLDGACLLGFLRWVSGHRRLNLRFENMPIHRFFGTDLRVDLDKLIVALHNHSQKSCDLSFVKSGISWIRQLQIDCWQVACGHDMVDLLSYALRGAIGSQQANDVTRDKMERALRLAFSRTDFELTHLYDSIRSWEAIHGYTVLS